MGIFSIPKKTDTQREPNKWEMYEQEKRAYLMRPFSQAGYEAFILDLTRRLGL